MAENEINENNPQAVDGQAGAQEPRQDFAIRSVYLKDSSFESPNAPAVFSQNVQPKFDINVNSGVTQVQENAHEVVLTLAITAKDEDKTVFHTEVQQAGLFESSGLNQQQLHQILGTFAPSQLFPYAREAVNSLINKGGFPSVVLQPINFEALYVQHMQQLAEQQQAAANQNPPTGNA
jgi:preprotein translocase subunit SecB